MTIVADRYPYVTGADTHARTHTLVILEAATGRTLDVGTFPTSAQGLARAVAWIHRRTGGAPTLVGVEGTGSYGAGLTRALQAASIRVVDVRPPRRSTRRGRGKSDPIDAEAAARTALAMDTDRLGSPRTDGIPAALRVLLAARHAIDRSRTADRNALNALTRIADLDVDARHALTDAQVAQIAAWRKRSSDDAGQAAARTEARRLARSVARGTQLLEQNREALARHVNTLAPGFTEAKGIGPVTAAQILAVYSHPGRVHSEAAFAAIAGVSPLPASSGNTVRHRLNRGGDRQFNKALDVIARVRMRCDDRTRSYVERRLAEGKTLREIRRILKRYIARAVYRSLTTITTRQAQTA